MSIHSTSFEHFDKMSFDKKIGIKKTTFHNKSSFLKSHSRCVTNRSCLFIIKPFHWELNLDVRVVLVKWRKNCWWLYVFSRILESLAKLFNILGLSDQFHMLSKFLVLILESLITNKYTVKDSFNFATEIVD